MKPLRSFLTVVREFMADVLDKSARKKPNPAWGTESLTTIGIAVIAASAQVEAVQKIASQFLGDYSSLAPVLLICIATFWCVAITSSKTQISGGTVVNKGVVSSQTAKIYNYSQPFRSLAKLGMCVLVISVPFKLKAIGDEWIPLPRTIYGYIYRGADEPVDGTRVWLISRDGKDITDGTWFTDYRGFYVVKSIRKLRRSDFIRAFPQQCKGELRLSLASSNEASAKSSTVVSGRGELSPMFVHHISCEVQK